MIARVVLPNIRGAVLAASFLSVALVLGQFTVANLLSRTNVQVAINLLGKRDPSISVAVALTGAAARVRPAARALARGSAAPRRPGAPPARPRRDPRPPGGHPVTVETVAPGENGSAAGSAVRLEDLHRALR